MWNIKLEIVWRIFRAPALQQERLEISCSRWHFVVYSLTGQQLSPWHRPSKGLWFSRRTRTMKPEPKYLDRAKKQLLASWRMSILNGQNNCRIDVGWEKCWVPAAKDAQSTHRVNRNAASQTRGSSYRTVQVLFVSKVCSSKAKSDYGMW